MITGAHGQLGRCLTEQLERSSGHRLVAALGHEALDIADGEACRRSLEGLSGGLPTVLVNAAAFTKVDLCETEPEEAERINAFAPGEMAKSCQEHGVRFVHLSTDYVFDGMLGRPYTEEDLPSPQSVYGRSKLGGERRVLAADPSALVIRTSWLFGPGRNFVRSMIEQGEARRRAADPSPLRVVADQFGSPTYAGDLAVALIGLVERGARGLYHVSNQGVATWWDVAREALDRTGFPELALEKVRTQDFPRPAPRPAYAVLDCRRAERLGVHLRDWRQALVAYLSTESARRSVLERIK